jgi:hypothetical protein
MRPGTEDLLNIRDGKPVDATLRAAVECDPRLAAELDHLTRTRDALRALPMLQPPAGGWERVLEDAAVQRKASTARRWHWPLRGALAASIAVLALWVVGRSPETPGGDAGAPSTVVGEQSPRQQSSPFGARPAYASLVEESARLERALDQIAYQPRVVRAGTVTTIADLEERIALVDERLWFAPAMNGSPAQTQALLRQRNELLNALYQVRNAEAQRFGF